MKNDASKTDLPLADRDPSNLLRRYAIAAVAGFACLVACYLGSYQAGVLSSVWDPIFGDGSEKVLLSRPALLLRSLILIPDAGMGAIAYFAAAVYAAAGPPRRWREKPWIVLLFGANVAALGFASTVLISVQGLVIGRWCFLCLVAAACSFTLVALAFREVSAAVGHVYTSLRGSGLGHVRQVVLGTHQPLQK